VSVIQTYIVSLARIHFSSLVSLYRIEFLELQRVEARIGGQAGTTDGTEGRPETASGSAATTANTTCSVSGYVVSTKVSKNIKVSRFQIYLLQPQGGPRKSWVEGGRPIHGGWEVVELRTEKCDSLH
jgi:hypothetical protein